ncbi:MAG TPA: hypothetical protein VLM89_03370, partial [Phycisphaerae bacterium]|nr:hypothetical protein [Phycisphaerae bacterium]
HIRLPMTDVQFCQHLVERFEEHLTRLSAQCSQIIVGLHHVPFPQLVPRLQRPGWAFAGAFLGSERFGQVVRRFPGIRYVLCGHSHNGCRLTIGHVECINVGCTYREKNYITIDV